MRLLIKFPLLVMSSVSLLCLVRFMDTDNERNETAPLSGKLFLPTKLITDADKLIQKDTKSNVGHQIKQRSDYLWSKCEDAVVRKHRILHTLNNIIIDRHNNITYCPIDHSASTSWKVTLLKLAQKWNQNVSQIPQLLTENFSVVKNQQGQEVTEGTVKFTVVRHPFDRLLSCFCTNYRGVNQIEFYKSIGEKIVLQYRETLRNYSSIQLDIFADDVRSYLRGQTSVILDENPMANPLGPTFKEFVSYVVSPSSDENQWRPFVQHCSMCTIRYDAILKFENLNVEGKYFLHQMLKNKRKLAPVDILKNPQRSPSFFCSYYKQLNKTLVQALQRKYYQDFIFFQYDYDKVAKRCKI